MSAQLKNLLIHGIDLCYQEQKTEWVFHMYN